MNKIYCISTIKRTIVFVFFFIVIALLYNAISPAGIPIITPTRQIIVGEKIYVLPFFNQPDSVNQSDDLMTITRINLDRAKQFFAEQGPLFLDARSPAEYKKGHIPGALNFPVNNLESFDLDLMTLPKSQIFITYCNDIHCDMGLELGIWLEEHGFQHIYYFASGWKVWKEKGNQISKGETP